MTDKDLLKAYKEAEERLQVLITDARGLQKDLKREVQAAKTLIRNGIANLIHHAVEEEVATMTVATKKAMNEAVKRVDRSFDRIENIYLGKDQPDKLSIEELVTAAKVVEHISDSKDYGTVSKNEK